MECHVDAGASDPALGSCRAWYRLYQHPGSNHESGDIEPRNRGDTHENLFEQNLYNLVGKPDAIWVGRIVDSKARINFRWMWRVVGIQQDCGVAQRGRPTGTRNFRLLKEAKSESI